MAHKIRSLDPLLGFAYGKGDLVVCEGELQMPGFVVLSAPRGLEQDALKVVALGGSTTTPHFWGNWPKQLKNKLEERGRPVALYNGGVNGYSSNQELLKLIRDVLSLRPDIVISLSGINDACFMHSIRRYPMIHPYTNHIMQYLLKNKIRSKQKGDRVNGISYGIPVDITPADQWEKNLRLMAAVSAEFDIRFYAFLQPVLGVGEYHASEREDCMLNHFNSERGGLYLNELCSFYEKARSICGEYKFLTDIVDSLQDCRDVYYDARHPNEVGYEAIAKVICERLLQDKGV